MRLVSMQPAWQACLTTFIGADGQSNVSESPSRFFSTELPTVRWDGNDPNGAGADYTLGNLWDTMTVDIHTLVEPPEPDFYFTVGTFPDALVWIAQVLSYSSGNQDSDGDGLKDGWELNGVNGLNLPALGADPLHKDLFVETDYMVLPDTTNTLPDKNHLDDMLAIFDNAPVKNPDGTTGIHLHIDTGGAANGAAPGTYPQYNLVGGSQVPYEQYLGLSDPASCTNYSWDEFDDYKDTYFSSQPARYLPLHDFCR